MATFTYNGKSLSLPVDPYEVSWTYKLNTFSTNTYDGVVVQILGHFIDTMNIKGQLPNLDGGNRFAFLDTFESFISDAMLWQQGEGQGDTEKHYIELSIPSLVNYYGEKIDFTDGYKFKVYLATYPNIVRDIQTNVPTYSLNLTVIEDGGAFKPLTEQDLKYKAEIGEIKDIMSGVGYYRNKYNMPDVS